MCVHEYIYIYIYIYGYVANILILFINIHFYMYVLTNSQIYFLNPDTSPHAGDTESASSAKGSSCTFAAHLCHVKLKDCYSSLFLCGFGGSHVLFVQVLWCVLRRLVLEL